MRKSIGKESRMNKSILSVALLAFSVTLSSCAPRVNAVNTATNPMIFQTLSALPQITRDPYSLEIETVETVVSQPRIIYQRSSIWQPGGLSWIAAKAVTGTPRIRVDQYTVASDINGNVLSRTLNVGETTFIDATPTVYKYGAAPTIGSVFFPSRIFRYGANCAGCYSKTGTSPTSSGVLVSVEPAVQQMDGTMLPGITYEGYYVLASSPRIPICTIVEITNHRFQGFGLIPNKPFKAIVLDRGVRDNTLDLFVGDESQYNSMVRLTEKQFPKVEIIGMGTPARNASGDRICKLP
jgi:hypothetical protein